MDVYGWSKKQSMFHFDPKDPPCSSAGPTLVIRSFATCSSEGGEGRR